MIRKRHAFSVFQWFLALLFGCFVSLDLLAADIVRLATSSKVTDDQIQAALDKLPDAGELVLPPGAYEIHHPIYLRHDGLTLRGSGPDTILHLADRANCPVIMLGSPAAKRVTTHLHLANLFINGNRARQQRELWGTAADGSVLNNNGIDVWNVNDVIIEHVVCRSCRSGGLVTASTRHLDVRDYSAYDNQFDGLACYTTEDSIFTGLDLHDNLAAGISLDLSFNHNTINDAVLTGNELGIFIRQSRDNNFAGLKISKSRKNGIFMAQTASPTPEGWKFASGTECTGNSFDGLVISGCGGQPFLIHDLSCKNNTIKNARFLKDAPGGTLPKAIATVNILDLIHP